MWNSRRKQLKQQDNLPQCILSLWNSCVPRFVFCVLDRGCSTFWPHGPDIRLKISLLSHVLAQDYFFSVLHAVIRLWEPHTASVQSCVQGLGFRGPLPLRPFLCVGIGPCMQGHNLWVALQAGWHGARGQIWPVGQGLSTSALDSYISCR